MQRKEDPAEAKEEGRVLLASVRITKKNQITLCERVLSKISWGPGDILILTHNKTTGEVILRKAEP
jgi:bifunctional DNA-binding transcriptional regulator/antitoxin component of YhaV-PrlF toxin-antitoxin module